jgi:hypothetical protein
MLLLQYGINKLLIRNVTKPFDSTTFKLSEAEASPLLARVLVSASQGKPLSKANYVARVSGGGDIPDSA